jgi:hypothetical protein
MLVAGVELTIGAPKAVVLKLKIAPRFVPAVLLAAIRKKYSTLGDKPDAVWVNTCALVPAPID